MIECFSCEKVSNIGFVFVAFSATNSGDVNMLFSSLDEMIDTRTDSPVTGQIEELSGFLKILTCFNTKTNVLEK